MSARGPTVWTGRALQAESDDLEKIGLALLYPALERNISVPGHHGYPRASDLILGKALKGQSGHQIRDATARPFSISSFRLADLGGKANSCFRDQLEPSPRSHRRSFAQSGERRGRRGAAAIPLVNLSVFISGCCLGDACFIAALLCQHCPGDPRQLFGEGRGQKVRMQALSSAKEPGPKTVLRPVR